MISKKSELSAGFNRVDAQKAFKAMSQQMIKEEIDG